MVGDGQGAVAEVSGAQEYLLQRGGAVVEGVVAVTVKLGVVHRISNSKSGSLSTKQISIFNNQILCHCEEPQATWQSLFMAKQYYVYIMTNDTNTVTYTGVTNDIYRRFDEHKNRKNNGFTSKYKINKLVYYEICEYIESVILREKQIKSWSREEKVKLVNNMNQDWHDLYEDLL